MSSNAFILFNDVFSTFLTLTVVVNSVYGRVKEFICRTLVAIR